MAFRKSHGKHARGEQKQAEQLSANASASDEQAEQASEVEASVSPSADEAPVAPSPVVPPIGSEQAAVPIVPMSPSEQKLASGVSAMPLPEIDLADASQGGQAAFVSADGVVLKPKRKALKIVGITFGVIIGVLLIAYIAGAIVFMGRFLPGTVMGDDDISLMSDADVVKLIDSQVSSYQIDIAGNGFSYRANGSEFGLSADADAIIASMHQDLNAWTWPVLLWEGAHDESGLLQVSYQHSVLAPELLKAVSKFNETGKDPVNATIEYSTDKNAFVVKAEEAGTKLDPHSVIEAADTAITGLHPTLSLTSENLIQPTVLKDDEKLNESAKLATGMTSAHVDLILAGKPVGVVDGKDLSAFVTVNQSLDVVFNEGALYAWIDALAEGFNTVESTRTYTRADGKEVTVSGGDYGWEVDTDALRDALINAVKTGTNTSIDIPCEMEADAYNGPGKPDWGNRYIDVDISEQYVVFYGDDGSVIWESPCITGSPDGKHDTVKGVWSINGKESPSKLIGYENGKKIYESSVTYWMPFEQNSIGFHDATWQPSFGGSMYAQGYGSHGCVNLPYSAAQELYSIVEYDDVVVVHD